MGWLFFVTTCVLCCYNTIIEIGEVMMKKEIGLMFAVFFLTVSFLSCSGKSYDFNETEMTTLGGEKVLLQEREDVVYSRDFGFGFVIPEQMMDMVKKGTVEIYPLSTSVTMLVAYSDGIFDLIAAFDAENSTPQEQEAIREQVNSFVFQAAAVARASIDVDQDLALAEIEMSYSNVKKIAETDQNAYYFAYNDDFSHLILAEGEEDKFNSLINDLKEFEDSIFVFNPVLQGTAQSTGGVNYNLSSFETETLDGQTVNESIFEDYDITMVNVWATWCGPCINEMPDLARLHKEMLPEGANMITVLTDVPDGIDVAQEIIAASNGEFITLFANDSLNGLLNTVSAIPTTVMVDSKGNIIGAPIVGAPPTNPAEMYLGAIESALATVNQ